MNFGLGRLFLNSFHLVSDKNNNLKQYTIALNVKYETNESFFSHDDYISIKSCMLFNFQAALSVFRLPYTIITIQYYK